VILEGLLGLVGALRGRRGTWLPVMPWQMTLVYLLIQTLGVVELNILARVLLSIMVNKISNIPPLTYLPFQQPPFLTLPHPALP
jgi:hypothetical protein